jgi:hypothetical protein
LTHILHAKTKPDSHTTYHAHRPAYLHAALHRVIYYVLFIQRERERERERERRVLIFGVAVLF